MKEDTSKRKKIGIYGNFGSSNFGNEITFKTFLYHLCRLLPDVKVTCICSVPESIEASHGIEAVPIHSQVVKPWHLRTPLARLLRKVFVGGPSELYRWPKAFRTLAGTNVLIIPGTGLLTDAAGLRGWGPYNIFKWSAMAKLRRCKVLFVSVGAGPIYSAFGRFLVKSALSLADFRSYRDDTSMSYLKSVGLATNGDRVYPDLVFSLPKSMLPADRNRQGTRPVVGIGLMEYAGKYSVKRPSAAIYRAYLENLVAFVKWLLSQKYDVRLLIGDTCDIAVTRDFISLLKIRGTTHDNERIFDDSATSEEELLSQLAATDIVVATRFHNVLLALLLNKPVIAISFHHKCASLMKAMGLSKYCHDINQMDADRLIEQFQDVERNAEELKPLIRQKVEEARKALDEQYGLIFKGL